MAEGGCFPVRLLLEIDKIFVRFPQVKRAAYRYVVRMGNLFVSHTSALAYWRAVGQGLVPRPQRVMGRFALNSETCIADLDALRAELRILQHAPLDISVEDRRKGHRTKAYRMHQSSTPTLNEHRCRVAENVFVASPELCLLQAAQTEKLMSLIELVMEFTGSYTLSDLQERGFSTHEPITSARKIRAFLNSIGPMKGAAQLERALKYAGEGSASPRETELFLLLTLPTRHGGYGFERPLFAQRIDIPDALRTPSDTPYMVADLLWLEQRVVVEYDGEFDHSGDDVSTHDKSRRSTLAAMGYTVVVFTKRDTMSNESVHKRISQVAHALGVKVPRSRKGVPDEKLGRLRGFLFNPRHHYLSDATRPLGEEML